MPKCLEVMVSSIESYAVLGFQVFGSSLHFGWLESVLNFCNYFAHYLLRIVLIVLISAFLLDPHLFRELYYPNLYLALSYIKSAIFKKF